MLMPNTEKQSSSQQVVIIIIIDSDKLKSIIIYFDR